MPLGMADVAAVLAKDFLRFDATEPDWPGRDRLVLSAGHGSMLLYSLLYLTGTGDLQIEDLKAFRQLHSKTPGHPERGVTAGVEISTGPLSEGLATAVGLALSERLLAARFGDTLVDHHTYVILGDGCLMEGLSQEALAFAGHLQLSKLIVLFDDNHITIDGDTAITRSEDTRQRFEALGWHVGEVDGHDPEAIHQAIAAAKASDKPAMVACKTVIGYGAPKKAGTAATHGAPLGDDEIAGMREKLHWPHPPFEVPEAILSAWREIGVRHAPKRMLWESRLSQLSKEKRAEWDRLQARELPNALHQTCLALKKSWLKAPPTEASRKSSQRVLDAIAPTLPEFVGGSADLTGSNLTLAKGMKPIRPGDFTGNYLNYGVREHLMAALMNGLAADFGFIPYGGTFLVFSDFCRPAMRLSGLMKLGVVYVMTHDSIGVGEDGPTHQPVEHVAALRAMPGIDVYRPADAIETLECWQAALEKRQRPSVLVLSRQNLPPLRSPAHGPAEENLSAKGAYVLSEAEGARQVTLLSTGSELHLAMQAKAALATEGIQAAVVSMPCWERFEAMPQSYQDAVLGDTPRVAIEAGSRFGWGSYVGRHGRFIGISDFGASGPGQALFAHYGITAEAVVDAAKEVLGR